MTLGRIARFAIVLVPLVVCAARIHAHRTATPQGMTQEINRCLSLVRATASRRRREQDRKLEQHQAATTEQAQNDPAAHGAQYRNGGVPARVA